mgnify:CR=1 FL=1
MMRLSKKMSPVAVLFLAFASSAAAMGLSEAQDAARGLLKNGLKLNGRAPLTAAKSAAAARTCWERAAQETADALGLPKRVCLDAVVMDRGDLIVTGEPVSGRFRADASGRAVVAHAYRSEGACESATSAHLYVAADGSVSGEVGEVHDVCHSSWTYEPVAYSRLP